MSNYKRVRIEGATYFFTVNLVQRHNTALLIDHIDALRDAFRTTQRLHPFEIQAIAVLPEHMHCLWRLPQGDDNYPQRWREIKARFSMALPNHKATNGIRLRKGERGIWQRRYWEHVIRDERDWRVHADYIHYNPAKHGHVSVATDWPYSSLRRYIQRGAYPQNWTAGDDVAELEFD